jgi:hypothetical protein
VTPWLERLAGERIYRAEALEIYVMDRDLVAALVAIARAAFETLQRSSR